MIRELSIEARRKQQDLLANFDPQVRRVNRLVGIAYSKLNAMKSSWWETEPSQNLVDVLKATDDVFRFAANGRMEYRALEDRHISEALGVHILTAVGVSKLESDRQERDNLKTAAILVTSALSLSDNELRNVDQIVEDTLTKVRTTTIETRNYNQKVTNQDPEAIKRIIAKLSGGLSSGK